MSVVTKVLIAGFSLVFVLSLTVCGSVLSFNNASVDLETQIKSQYTKNQAVYDTVWKSIKETANVADAHSDKLKAIVVASVQGRYANDDGVLFKAIAESNTAGLPTDLYKKVQQIIESGRQQFLANQVELVARKQTYEKHLNTVPNVFYARLLGFPKINLSEYDIVTSDRTEQAFSSKRADEILPF